MEPPLGVRGGLSSPFIVGRKHYLSQLLMGLGKLHDLGESTVDVLGSLPTKHINGDGRGVADFTSRIEHSKFPQTGFGTIASAGISGDGHLPPDNRCPVSIREPVSQLPTGTSRVRPDISQVVDVTELDDFEHQFEGTERLDHVLSHVTFLSCLIGCRVEMKDIC